METTKKTVNYLNNKDILKEIHLSKNSYCSFIKPEYHQYDIIIDVDDNLSLEKNLDYAVHEQNIILAKEQYANRNKVSIDEIEKTDLIFRIMTWDHIPKIKKEPKKTKKTKSATDFFDFESDESSFDELEDQDLNKTMGIVGDHFAKVNFPPFQHFKFDENNNFVCIGKSHWIGDIDTGSFSKDHGQITKKLAKMYIMLCEKYALRFNWRGYTYNDEMRGSAILQLTYVGLRFNEAKSQNPFAYYTAAINNSFCRVLNTEKRNQNIRDDILEMNNLNPSWSRQFSNDYASHDD